MSTLRGLFRHLRTQNLYFVDGLARNVTNPNKLSVVYSQEYDSVLKGTDTELLKGTMWIRDIDDFQAKFEKVEQTKPEKFITSVRTSLGKDMLFRYNKA